MSVISGICGKCKKYYSGAWCPACEKVDAEKTLNFIADFHEEYYDHALGQVIKSRQHRARVMKEKGLFEIGNEWKYIDPERTRREIERKQEREFENLKKESIQRWNSLSQEY